MMLSTPGLVLHTTPYGESSVIAKVFTRQLGVRSYIVKGVRRHGGGMKQNLFAPLSSLDMVVYDSHKSELNHVKELAPRHPDSASDPVGNALRFFMTEVLYKSLREEEPMPELWDYVESVPSSPELPVLFLLRVAHYLGIEPLDNYSVREPLFDLQEGRFVSSSTETTLTSALSYLLHEYLLATDERRVASLTDRRALIDALIAYYQLHLSGFRQFHSHEILHTILK
ncbi:MAG: recombination protein O N-terminal domain-containing protein [Bacteroidales bacterium]|nr:recombination protein O N-terminal domain-containing protein [Bacteroidales bacterium]